MTVLLIGEAPSDDGRALEGRVGARLAEYAGLSPVQYLELTERRNLFQHPVDAWDAQQAEANAQLLWPALIGRHTIVLGQRVAKAFGWRWETLKWMHLIDGQGTSVAILPHPSGRNLWWAEAENRSSARRFLMSTFGTGDRFED